MHPKAESTAQYLIKHKAHLITKVVMLVDQGMGDIGQAELGYLAGAKGPINSARRPVLRALELGLVAYSCVNGGRLFSTSLGRAAVNIIRERRPNWGKPDRELADPELADLELNDTRPIDHTVAHVKVVQNPDHFAVYDEHGRVLCRGNKMAATTAALEHVAGSLGMSTKELAQHFINKLKNP